MKVYFFAQRAPVADKNSFQIALFPSMPVFLTVFRCPFTRRDKSLIIVKAASIVPCVYLDLLRYNTHSLDRNRYYPQGIALISALGFDISHCTTCACR